MLSHEGDDEDVLDGWILVSLSSSVIGDASGLALVVCLQEQSVKGWLW